MPKGAYILSAHDAELYGLNTDFPNVYRTRFPETNPQTYSVLLVKAQAVTRHYLLTKPTASV